MKKITFLILAVVLTQLSFSQTKNFIDQPYLETSAKVDTMITPDRIYMSIVISESDTKNKISVEELENRMADMLKNTGIDIKKQLTMSDLSSNFKKYFLKQKNILKTKNYSLVVYNAVSAGKVIAGMEEIGISNVNIDRVEYSKIEELKLELRSKAVSEAKKQAVAMLKPLGQKTGPAIYISDGYSNVIYNSRISADVQYAPKSMAKIEPIDVDFEKIKVMVNISVKFKID